MRSPSHSLQYKNRRFNIAIMVSDTDFKNTELSATNKETYPDTETRDYLKRQSELYESQLAQLLKQYNGMYIVFEDGKVIDSDKDEAALVMRAYEKMGIKDLFVKKVIARQPMLRAKIPFTLQ